MPSARAAEAVPGDGPVTTERRGCPMHLKVIYCAA
jgi:hypothetical protein